MIRLLSLCAIAISLAGCGASRPDAVQSRLFSVTGAGVSVDWAQSGAHYMLSLKPKVPLNQPVYLQVYYENPLNPKGPFVEGLRMNPGQQTVLLESEFVSGFEPGKIYEVEVEAYADASHTQEMDRLKQPLRNMLPPRVMRTLRERL